MTINFKSVKKHLLEHWVLYIPLAVLLLAMTLISVYAKWFPSLNVFFKQAFYFREAPAWGQIGDFFGGIMNPIIAFCTLIVAVLVWRLQKLELKETRDAIKQQAFDQFFMSMLASHRAMTEQVTLVDAQAGNTLQTGKRAIDSYITHLDGHVEAISKTHSGKTVGSSLLVQDGVALVKSALAAQVKKVPNENAIPQFSYFFTQYYNTRLLGSDGLLLSPRRGLSFEQIFGHIFRLTHQILRIIDEEFIDAPVLKKRYVNLLRAQMSESEFIFFALSALTKDGEKSWARSIQLNFFEDRLQNLPWTQKLAESFAVNEVSLIEAKQILRDE